MNRRAGSITLLLVLSTTCQSQTTGDLNTFFKQNIGLGDSEIAQIEQGKAVAKILSSHSPSQVFVFGAISINAQPRSYLRLATDLDKLKSLPGYIAIQRFSNPPVLSDLSGFSIDAADVDELKKCKPGDCELQLPVENIEAFRSKIDWSGADPTNQANILPREMILRELFSISTFAWSG